MKQLLFLLSFVTTSVYAGIGDLLPKPQQVKPNGERYEVPQDEAALSVSIKIVDDLPQVPINKEEAYTLEVTKKGVSIKATTEKGVYWAKQTLKQLVVTKGKKSYYEGCTIIDYPAFRIRGFMHDTGRSYISVEELKKEIALLSQYKINVFHWHLTENQGWRLQSIRFPQLNSGNTYERLPEKYYTLEEAKELVAYCKAHNMLLIPEIDMPGHSRAFEKAFGTDMQSPQGIKILKEILDEVVETFEVPYIHIGTDEVAFTNPAFVPEMVAYIRAKGKKVISWNPGWHYKEGEIDMTQLWSYRGKAQKGIPAIDSRYHYINHFDTFADLVALYNSRILNVAQGDTDHAGAIVALWNDRYIPNERENILQNNFYPAMLALAERSWMGGGTEYFDGKGTMLPIDTNDPVFKDFADFERRMCWHKEHNFVGEPFAYVPQTAVEWNITDAFPNNGNLAKVFPPEEALKEEYTYEGKTYSTRKAIGAGIYLRHTWGKLVPAFYTNPEPNHTAYAYTYVYSRKKQKAGLWVSFQNYSRSERDLPPRQGKWDYKESKLWLNGQELAPPQWESQHTELSNEIPLTNENFEVRKPLPITLNKGWNKLLLKLPVGAFNIPEIRLVKWQFTCVVVTPEGNDTPKGIKYSISAEKKKNGK
ncbi:family 20 glycosylhydrolase [Capnocytophaga sp. oral taxon 878]|uniref:family 20 glycosylhydrolase n=1 Tax=Capnocytophaga sp. oral taxon 878 TaxID=1316596 RepID=UPI000D0261C0|nr:family 20 glycosylhydrolase [Capnocytophaga sp. oral taxon 878]AVM51340.1 beta-N-acetylhexosaminidase [Capnocytophaga sp. oral taxon 878]